MPRFHTWERIKLADRRHFKPPLRQGKPHHINFYGNRIISRCRTDKSDYPKSAQTKNLQALPDNNWDHMTNDSDTDVDIEAPSPEKFPVYDKPDGKKAALPYYPGLDHDKAPDFDEGPVSSRTRSTVL